MGHYPEHYERLFIWSAKIRLGRFGAKWNLGIQRFGLRAVRSGLQPVSNISFSG